MTYPLHETESVSFVFPGGWKADIEARLDSLKTFAESGAAKKFEAAHESGFEVVVTITERKKV